MTSIYQHVLGSEFERLHPRLQERFGFSSADGIAQVGRGTMQRVWHGPWFTVPFLMIGTWRNIFFPNTGTDVPFTVENYAYRDRFGRETVTWVRTYDLPRRRRFDATMIHSAQRGRIVDYLGTHQHLAVDIDCWVSDRGGLRLRTGEQRLYEGPIAFRFPTIGTGIAEVEEWFDDALGRFRITVHVANRRFGPLFGYEGTFDVDRVEVRPEQVPLHVKPLREERRE